VNHRRAHRGIDMLPLLDVFMVVLFVFATIQETKLDDSAQELEALRHTVAILEVERDALADQATAAVAREQALEDRLAAAEVEADERVELEARVAEFERVCGPAKPGGPVCPAIELEPREAAEQLAVDTLLARLFDNIAVFEIELDGAIDAERQVLLNPCCYRSDPPKGEWKSCGDIPSDADERAAWLDDGGQGLLEALRRDHGGNAIVILRQGAGARYRQTNDLADLLREQLPDHRIYDDGSVATLDCPLLAR
jgi:hypothetical protein